MKTYSAPPATYEEAVERLNAQLRELWEQTDGDPEKQALVRSLADVLRRERPGIITLGEGNDE